MNNRLEMSPERMIEALNNEVRIRDIEIERLNTVKDNARDELARLRAENDRLREALLAWEDAVKLDMKMEGPVYMGVEYTRSKKAWGLTVAVLEGDSND